MEPQSVERKLTAILSADVKGYSRLMGDDEEATLHTLTAYRDVFSSHIDHHRGRVVNTPGDAILAEFASVVDAVACAVEIQRELAERNAELPDARRMAFRIGINLGDVLVKEGALYGDGVNIAARLESLADPGGICISGKVHAEVETKLPLQYESMGEQTVKNIKKPVPVYRVLSQPGAAAHRVVRARRLMMRSWRRAAVAAAAGLIVAGVIAAGYYFSRLGDAPSETTKGAAGKIEKASIAVLPFVNLSGDPELEHFGDGLTEDIITSLSKYQELSVTARNSVFAYKNKPVDVRQVAEALGVGYVLEGSVRISEAENRVRVTAQLIDGATGNHLWAEKYDRTMESVFDLQDEITDKISVALDVALLEGELSEERRSTTESAQAYELFKRANELYSLETIEANTKAKELSRQVIALDPESPLGWMQLAFCHWEDLVLGGWSQHPQKDLDQAYQSISKSIAIDDSMPENYMLLGFLHLYAKRYAEARAEAEHAVNLSPNNADGVGVLGQILNFLGEPKEAIVNLEKAFRLAPTPPKWLHPELGHAYFLIAQYDKAVEVLQQGVSRFPDYYRGYLYLAAAYGALGRESEAEMAVAQVLRMRPNFTVEELEPWILQHKNPDHVEHLRNGLRQAGLK
ncbi:MAG: adenylate/guanylate cyclase domain-containing protein [SAR324 cluster bacterium]|nr:adenylate/guanylate cyclase domain-containing protein [SAR324 cluster bacterium]